MLRTGLYAQFYFGNCQTLVTSVCKMVPIKTDVAAKILAFSNSLACSRLSVGGEDWKAAQDEAKSRVW